MDMGGEDRVWKLVRIEEKLGFEGSVVPILSALDSPKPTASWLRLLWDLVNVKTYRWAHTHGVVILIDS